MGGEWSLDELGALLSAWASIAAPAAPSDASHQAHPEPGAPAPHPDMADLTARLPGRSEAHVAAVCDALKVRALSFLRTFIPT